MRKEMGRMRRGKAVLALALLTGAAAIALGGCMDAERQTGAEEDRSLGTPLEMGESQSPDRSLETEESQSLDRSPGTEESRSPDRSLDPGPGEPEHLLGVCVGNGPGDLHGGGKTDPAVSGPHDP